MSVLASPSIMAGAWFGLVLVGAWQRRPRVSRLAELLASGGSVAGRRASPIERLGGTLRRVVRRSRSMGERNEHALREPDRRGRPSGSTAAPRARGCKSAEEEEAADRRVGRTVVAGAAVALFSPWLVPLVVAGVWVWSLTRARRTVRLRRELIAENLPDVVDLFTLAAGAGLTVPLSVEAVARHTPGPVGEALAGAVQRQRLGERSADALGRLTAEIGEAVRPLTDVLIASERYGTALLPALEALAAEVGGQRRRLAEERARRAPVKLIFPLVLCSLPAFALLTVVPLLLSTLSSLRF